MLLLLLLLVLFFGIGSGLYWLHVRNFQRRLHFVGQQEGGSRTTTTTCIPGPVVLPFIGNALWMLTFSSSTPCSSYSPFSLLPRIDVLNSLQLLSSGFITQPQLSGSSSGGGCGLVLFWLGTTPFLLVHKPSVAREILQSKAREFRKGVFASSMRPLMGQGLLLIDGERWKVHHRIAAPSYQNFRDSLTGIVDRNLALHKRWRHLAAEMKTQEEENEGRTGLLRLEICHDFSRLTLDSIGELAFGKHFGAISPPVGEEGGGKEKKEEEEEDSSVFHEVAVVLREMQKDCERLYPWLNKGVTACLPSFIKRRVGNHFRSSTSKIHRLVRRRMEERRAELRVRKAETTSTREAEAEAEVEGEEEEGKDKRGGETEQQRRTSVLLLDTVLEGIEKKLLTEEEAQDEMVTAVMGGHETTASLMSWVTFMLVKHPKTLAQVTEEVDQLFQETTPRDGEEEGTTKRPLEWNDLNRLHRLSSVVHETLRLYPRFPWSLPSLLILFR
jgi:cytochrome P450